MATEEEKKELARQRTAAWRKANPGKNAEANKKWREANPDRCKANAKSWHARNPDKAREYGRAYYARNPETCKQRTEARRKAKRPEYNARQAKWRAANHDKVKLTELRQTVRAYGLTLEQYELMLTSQGGVCKLCERKPGARRLAVDHCHKTGKVRGLLCAACNSGLGKLGDSIDMLKKAIAYLGEYAGPEPV